MRDAQPEDIAAIRAIYAHSVLTGLGSFEELAPSEDEMLRRYGEVRQRRLPYLAAQFGDEVVGYAYCAPYRARSAYRFTLEDSVYVRQDMQGQGFGSALLAQLIGRAQSAGYRQLVAVIGDSAHAASIGLHASQGFLRVGTLRAVGFKLGRWVDSVLMQRALGAGDASRP